MRDGEAVEERMSPAIALTAALDDLLRSARVDPDELDALAVGVGPGSFTGLRMGLATARGLALSLDLPVAGVSTLDALSAGAPGAMPVIDAKRREIFTVLSSTPVCLRPEDLALEPGTVCVGDGAIRYRSVLEAAGAEVPPDGSELHLPRARFHAQRARDFGPAELVEPMYLRVPDAERARA
ncbi:MAG: tRNA (adenosine(37)-N6)-threonylcarbamoyltransferase complex dimerization subunit type 1 TsaB [Actinomycetota bacterium]|nr:tRNA (adenosine(37)-N6)-threonylcarbamoyltransferase complex dimerization subunit type 1 TsaB [Actinomycetota bacterium]